MNIPPHEWWAIITVRPNVLVEGPDDESEKIVHAIVAAVRGSVREWHAQSADHDSDDMLIVRRADRLDAADHDRLMADLSAESSQLRVRQVITTSAKPLFRLMESGLFPEQLYYRLNTIRLELDDS